MTDSMIVDDIRTFYDALAPEYDVMTDFPRRFAHERPFFHMLVEKFNLRTALDAGTGTGFHALLLAQLGLSVTAIDISVAMLKGVSQHAKAMKLKIETVETPFQTAYQVLNREFDFVLSMGNSLAHLQTAEDLRDSLGQFFACTRPGGFFFAQNLNYNRILAQKEKIQSVKENGNTTFVRFYDFAGDHVIFNIIIIHREHGIVRQQHNSIRLHPILQEELTQALVEAGFSDVRTYGSIALSEFEPMESKDLVVVARRPGGKDKY